MRHEVVGARAALAAGLAMMVVAMCSAVGAPQTYYAVFGDAGEVPYGEIPAIDAEIGDGWDNAYHVRKLIRSEAGQSIWTDIYLTHDNEYLACAAVFDTRSEADGAFSGWGFIDNGDSYIWNTGDDMVIVPDTDGRAQTAGLDMFYPAPESFQTDISQDASGALAWSRRERAYVMEWKKLLRSQDPFDVFLEPCTTFLLVIGFDVVLGGITVDEGWVAIKIHIGLPALVEGCAVTPTMLDFGTVAVGGSVTRAVTVTNTGQTTLTVSATEYCAEFVVMPATLTLGPGASAELQVTYTPVDVGPDTCPIQLSLPCQSVVAVGAAEQGCPDLECECPSRLPEDEVTERVLRAKQCIDAAGAVCADTFPPPSAYDSYMAAAEAEWQAMTVDEKKDLLTLIGQERLGRLVCLRIDGPDPQVQNPARVTTDGDTVVMTFGGTYFGLDNRPGVDLSVLNSTASWNAYFQQYYPTSVPPPPPTLTDSWPVPSYDSLLDFFCYEIEVVRIRHYIECFCKRSASEAPEILALMQQVDATIPFFNDHSRQVDAYEEFMRRVRALRRGLPYEYYASWMFEYILANGGVVPSGCDMPLSFDGVDSPYQQNVSPDLTAVLIHDIDAEALGDLHCPCCGCGVGYPSDVLMEL